MIFYQLKVKSLNSHHFSHQLQGMQKALQRARAIFCACILLCCITFASAETETILHHKNEYGGKTVQYTYQEDDHFFSKLTSSIYYYDIDGDACRVIHHFNDVQSQLSGFATQEERLDKNTILSYKLTLTTKQRAEQGIDYIVEYMGLDSQVVRKRIVQGEYSHTEQTGSFVDNYPFYALDVLQKYLETDDTQEILSDKNVYKFSAFFSRGRSFAKFTSGIRNVSDNDKRMIAAYMDCYNQQNLTKLFTKKIEVSVGKNSYVAYIQSSLLPYIKKNKTALISYSALMFNGKMCLLLTDVGDLD